MYPLVLLSVHCLDDRLHVCFQAQTSAGDPSLPVSRPQQGQLHPQQWLRLLLSQHPQTLAAQPRPQLSPRGGPPEPVPIPRASLYPALPRGGARELLIILKGFD